MSAQPTPEPLTPSSRYTRLADLASGSRRERNASLHALHVLEYALSAPAPRRQRTWVHRVTVALRALSEALVEQLHTDEESMGLLGEIALAEPQCAARVHRLRQSLLDLTISVASLREQIEPAPEFPIDPGEIRDRLATMTRRFRQLRADEADMIYEAFGIDVDDEPGLGPPPPSIPGFPTGGA